MKKRLIPSSRRFTSRRGAPGAPVTAALLALPLLSLAIPPPAAHADPPGTGWSQTFNDDFTSSSLDTSKWITTWNQGNRFVSWSQEYMLDDHVAVSNGACHIRQNIDPNPPDGSHHDESGVICSYDSVHSNGPKFLQKYGYFEGRLKTNTHPGTLNALWMAAPNSWPPELDIVESLGNQSTTAYLTQHWYDTGWTDNNAYDQSSWTGADFAADWHTFGMYWSPSTLIWYIDGIEKKRTPNHMISSSVGDVPMFLQANIHAGNTWAGYPSNSDNNNYYMDIDYIRAWSKSDYSTTPGDEYLLSRSGWTASASAGNASASSALDGNNSTFYNSGTPQTYPNFYGNWFQVDMGASRTFNKLLIDAGSRTGDIPSYMYVNASTDGSNWTTIWTGSPSSTQYLYFNPTTARYLRLVNYTGDSRTNSWSIAEFKAYNDTGTPASAPPIGQRISMQPQNVGYYVSTDLYSAPANLRAAWATSVGTWEQFDVVDAGSGLVALKAVSNGYYVSTDLSTSDNLRAAWATSIGSWEQFQWVDLGSGKFALKSPVSGYYVSCDTGNSNTLRAAYATSIGTSETFTKSP